MRLSARSVLHDAGVLVLDQDTPVELHFLGVPRSQRGEASVQCVGYALVLGATGGR